MGNPVHYVVASDDSKFRSSMRELLLLGALLQRHRLLGKRYCVLNLSPDSSYCARKLNDIYQSQKGCALVLSLTGEFGEESQYASASFEFVASLGEKVAC